MSIHILALLILTLSIISPVAWSAAPSSFNYAGQVSVNGTPFEGNGSFKFALVNFDCTEAPSAIASNCQTVWSNDGSSTQGSPPGSTIGLIVSNGKFNVNIGDTSVVGIAALDPSLMQQQLYLRTWFDDGQFGSEQLKPDYALNSVPYALASKVAENGMGKNQSWQNMLDSRSVNGVYLNDTGRPITVNITIGVSGSQAYGYSARLSVGSSSNLQDIVIGDLHGHGPLLRSNISAIIPNGQYYKLAFLTDAAAPSVPVAWSELR